MHLTEAADVIRIRLAGAVTTNELQWSTDWKILTTSSGALADIPRLVGKTNGTTNVTIVTSPAATDSLQVARISVINTDTVTHTVTIEFYDGTDATLKKKATLQSGQSLEYTRESGKWIVYSVAGPAIGETGANGADYTDTWMYFATTYSVAPAVVGTPTGTTVYSYTLNGTTRYRSVPDTYDPTTDAFYTSWSGSAVSGLIVARG